MRFELDIKVLGGLPVTIEGTISGPEYDVGIMGPGCDDWEITRIADRKCKSPEWIYKRLNDTKEINDVELKVQTHAAECYYNPPAYDD